EQQIGVETLQECRQLPPGGEQPRRVVPQPDCLKARPANFAEERFAAPTFGKRSKNGFVVAGQRFREPEHLAFGPAKKWRRGEVNEAHAGTVRGAAGSFRPESKSTAVG